MEDNKKDGVQEQGFNESELEDIMNEIENLEKEFVDESSDSPDPASLKVAPEDVKKHDLQDEVDKEVEAKGQEDEIPETKPAPQNVVSIQEARVSEAPKAAAPTAKTDGCETEMDFTVSGQMNVKLNFTIAGKTVHLEVNEQDGFTIEMAGGVKFTVPLETTSHQAKRKAV